MDSVVIGRWWRLVVFWFGFVSLNGPLGLFVFIFIFYFLDLIWLVRDCLVLWCYFMKYRCYFMKQEGILTLIQMMRLSFHLPLLLRFLFWLGGKRKEKNMGVKSVFRFFFRLCLVGWKRSEKNMGVKNRKKRENTTFMCIWM